MNKKQWAAALCLAAALAACASPALARGRGGGRMGGASITRTAPRPSSGPAQTPYAAPQQERTQPRQPIDQGIDPKDYGKRNTGRTAAAEPGQQAGRSQTTQNQFTGGTGGFFNGFSLWPWLWFSGHSQAAAEDQSASSVQSGEAKSEEEGFLASISRWWDGVVQFFQSLFSF